MKNKKTLAVILIVFIISAICTSCRHRNNNAESEFHFGSPVQSDMTYEEIIAAASHIMKAEYVGVAEGMGSYDYLEFKPTENIKGTPEGSLIGVVYHNSVVDEGDGSASDVDKVTGDIYEPGTEYLLILNRIYSVFLDRELYVASVPMVQKCISQERYNRMADKSIDYDTLRNSQISAYEARCAEAAKAARGNDTSPQYSSCHYVRSDRIEDITAGSTYIFRVKALEKKYEIAENNSEGYTCLVTAALKGTADSETISVQFRKDNNVTPGKEYLILVVKIDNSVEYYVSSKNSVFPVTDTAAVSQIETLIGDAAK